MLSIIIPYYKLTFFEETLQSLANQTDKRFKVYIGDDASPEDCTFLLKKFGGRFDFLYHRFESNLGSISLTQHWERCISLSSDEEWIMILGDDDYLDKTVVASWYEHYNLFNGQSNVIRFATKLVNEKSGIITETYQHPKWERASDSYFRRFKGLTRSSLSEYVFLKSSYLKYGFCNYPLGWHSDDIAWINFSEDKLIYSINDCLVFVRMSEINISGKLDNVAQKWVATSLFLGDIIKQKSSLFNKEQRLELFYEFEVAIKKYRKLYINEWFILVEKYLMNFQFISFLKFNRRFIKSFFDL